MCGTSRLFGKYWPCVTGLFAAAVLLVFDAGSAEAQTRAVGPAPGTSPVLSPYLDLLRFRGGVLPNYQQFVRPKIQFQQAFNRQQRELEQQSRALRSVERRVSTIRDATGLTTGVRSGFLQYSTFYPGLQRP